MLLTHSFLTCISLLGYHVEPPILQTAWADMPKHVQKAAEKLGWDQTKWDDDWDTETWEKSWSDFTPEEQRCLHVMGYYMHTWD